MLIVSLDKFKRPLDLDDLLNIAKLPKPLSNIEVCYLNLVTNIRKSTTFEEKLAFSPNILDK